MQKTGVVREPRVHNPDQAIQSDPISRRVWWLFVLIVIGVLLIRVPVMFREPGEMDEECYAVPGLTVLQTGIPKMPHIPGRSEQSVFYHADEILFAEPPVLFYLQAIFYAILPPVYGTARMATLAAGIGALGFMWAISRRWLGGWVAAVWAVGLFANARWFFLHAIRARPDMLCSMFGIAAMWAVFHWRETGKPRWLVLAGVMIGLGGLTHPFALAYAVPIALWVMYESRGINRLWFPGLLALVSILTASSWLLLIVQSPEIFWVQFRNQFLNPYDPLPDRIATPWHFWWFHAGIMLDQIKPWQYFLAVGPLTFCTFFGSKETRIIACISWASMALIAFMVGTHHAVAGYFTFPSGLMFLCTGWCIHQLSRFLPRIGSRYQVVTVAAAIALMMSMIRISRLGTLLVHLENWNSINFNAPRFAQMVMADIPQDSLCAVDSEFLLDFVAARRKVILARHEKVTIEGNLLPVDFIIGSRMAIENKIYIKHMPSEIIRTYGDFPNLYSCFAEVRIPTHVPPKQ